MAWWPWRPADTPSGLQSDSVARIAEVLNHLPEDRARYLAAFAYLLGRVAHADHAVTPAESEAMVDIVEGLGGLSREEAEVVVGLAQDESWRERGTEDFPATQDFRALATDVQKRALLECLFAVSASDAAIVVAEDNEIRRISQELKMPHADFIAARSAYREHLAVLRLRPRQS